MTLMRVSGAFRSWSSALPGCSVLPIFALGLGLWFSAGSDAMAAAAPADAQPAAASTTPSDATKTAADTVPADPVQGFRSATFGMSEADVRKAVQKDFGIAPDAIKADVNRAEKTHTLTASVADVLPGGGRATVAYVFGYKNDKLIQVGVTWSKATDPALTPETLYVNAQQLQEYLLQAGYVSGSVATNVPVANGILMFHGADSDARETLLVLEGTMKPLADAKRALSPTALNLIYKVAAKDLDIYRLPKGNF